MITATVYVESERWATFDAPTEKTAISRATKRANEIHNDYPEERVSIVVKANGIQRVVKLITPS